jgi:sialate O-acetylesterase
MKKITMFLLLTVFAGSGYIHSAIRLPAIIGDNMVLQNNVKLPVWGWATAGSTITVEFKNKQYTTVTKTNGKWLVTLNATQAGGPYQMSLNGDGSRLTLQNILVGEVWLASGQSNMELGIQLDTRGTDAIAHATDSLIHFFYTPMGSSLWPQEELATIPAGWLNNGRWLVCSPKLLSENWGWAGFSAVGYYFAKEIRHSTGRPVGIIGSYKGGTPAQAWVSITGLQQDSALAHYVTIHQKLLAGYDEKQKVYLQQQASYETALKEWNTDKSKPRPQAPAPPDGGYNAPANLFNAKIAPLIPYAIKGVIWYQGESNGDRSTDAHEYVTLFPRLVTDWRQKWNQGNFPFLFVQLPNYKAPAKTPSEGNWPWIREAQLKTLSLPHTGMAVIIDLGDAADIHPKDKYDVGARLALVARQVAYHEKVVYSGPVYESMKIKENEIILHFSHTGKGLVIGSAPGITVSPELKGFGIAGADKKFVWAKARIEGNTVIVSGETVKNPVAVRYAWADNPPANLYNKEGLPASPFRTDNWPE